MMAQKLWIVFAVLILLSSCGEIDVQDNSNSPHIREFPNTTTVPLFPPRNETPFIEITTLQTGMSIDAGTQTIFRLYHDGLAEFDVVEASQKANKIDERIIRKYVKVSNGELSILKELLASREFHELKTEYNKIGQSCDAVPVITFRTQIKKIEIIWCDDISAPHRSPDLPQIISILFRHVADISSGEKGTTEDLEYYLNYSPYSR